MRSRLRPDTAWNATKILQTECEKWAKPRSRTYTSRKQTKNCKGGAEDYQHHARKNREETRLRTLKHLGQEYRGGTQRPGINAEQAEDELEALNKQTERNQVEEEEAAREESKATTTREAKETTEVENNRKTQRKGSKTRRGEEEKKKRSR